MRHGILTTFLMYAALLPHLTDVFRVIALDSRGHGRSTNPGGELHEVLSPGYWNGHGDEDTNGPSRHCSDIAQRRRNRAI